jgi:hypothetical protein
MKLPNSTEKKVHFILTWYSEEQKKLNNEQKKALLEKWISSCTKYEEYEMADALLKKKIEVIRAIRTRTFFQKILLKIKVILRRIKK